MNNKYLTTVLALQDLFRKQFQPVPNDWLNTPEFLAEYFGRPGKSLRPLFFLLSYLMAGKYRGIERMSAAELDRIVRSGLHIWNMASALERFHIACLAVDDVLDGGTERRGGSALHILYKGLCRKSKIYEKHGEGEYFHPHPIDKVVDRMIIAMVDVAQAILRATGRPEDEVLRLNDFANESMIAHKGFYLVYGKQGKSYVLSHLQKVIDGLRAFSLGLVGSQYDLYCFYLNVLQRTLDGEIQDQVWTASPNSLPTIQDVLWQQGQKTTFYSVAFPLELGVVLADPGASRSTRATLATIAQDFGEAFSIHDDLLVILPEEESGKSVLTDLKNGSRTFVTVAIHEMLKSDKAKEEWLTLLVQCRMSELARAKALEVIKESGVIDLGVDMIGERLDRCRQNIDALKEANYPALLLWALIENGVGWMDDLSGSFVTAQGGTSLGS